MQPPQQLDVIQTISPTDDMYVPSEFGERQYFDVGESALENIDAAMQMAGKSTVSSILDLPCGYGRVTRYLRAAFPQAKICGCDLNREGVDFCARTFGVEPLYSSPRFRDIDLPETFDLIWSGSLLTHLPQDLFEECFDFYMNHLSANGLLVLSFIGRYSLWYRANVYNYAISDQRWNQIVARYKRTGFGYGDYDHQSQYGLTLVKLSWLEALIEQYDDARIVYLKEAGWSAHQNIIGIVKAPIDGGWR